LIHFTIKESDFAIESLHSEGNESALGKRRIKHGLQYAINYNVTRIFIGYQELSILQLTCLKQCYIPTPNALILYNVIEKMSPYDSPMSYSWMSEKVESNLTLNSLSKSKNIYLSKASKIIQSATTLMESTLYIGHSRYGFPNTTSK
jgi:hypothetical protein